MPDLILYNNISQAITVAFPQSVGENIYSLYYSKMKFHCQPITSRFEMRI